MQVFASRTAAELERRRAERELDRQRGFAESLLDMVASLVLVVDSEGRIVRFNRACEATSGWREDEIRGTALLGGPLAARGARRRGDVLRDPGGGRRAAGGHESTWLTRAGDRRLIHWTTRAIQDEAGEVTSVIGTGVDITDSRRTEEALRASEARYRTLMQNAPEAILVMDVARAVFVDANANAERLFGLARDELLDTDPFALFPAETQPDGETSHEMARRLIEEAVDGDAPVSEVVHRTAGERDRPCEVRIVRLPGPQELLRMSIIDISERKRLEADLRSAALEWRQTFDGLPIGVLVVDGEGAGRPREPGGGRALGARPLGRPHRHPPRGDRSRRRLESTR